MVTAVATDCQHGMPTPASCMDCMYEGNVPPAPRPEREHVAITFEAKFEGHCGGCDLPIYPGQQVHRLEPTGRYVHAFSGCEPA